MLLGVRVSCYLKSIQGDCMKSCFLKILGTWPLSRAKGSVGNWRTGCCEGQCVGCSAGARTSQCRGIRSAPSRGVTWAHPGSHQHPEGSTKHGNQRRGVKRGCPGKVANVFLQPPPQRAAGTSFRQRCPGQMLISPQPHCLIHYSESKLILFSSKKK